MKTLPYFLLLALFLFTGRDVSQTPISRDVSGVVSHAEGMCADIIPVPKSEWEHLSINEKLDELQKEGRFKKFSPQAQSKDEYCASKPRDLLRRLCYLKGKLGQDNDGGLFGLPTGVCWWNSQFHRKVTFLTYFDPQTPSQYSDDEFRKIIKNINRYKVTKINGYENFIDFLHDKKWPNRTKILKKFLQQQMGKSALLFDWINGLKGKSNKIKGKFVRDEEHVEEQLAEIEHIRSLLFPEDLDSPRLPVTMLQNPGVMAHSFIVYDLVSLKDKFGNKAHLISVQDSMFQSPKDTNVNQYYFDEEMGLWFKPDQYKKLVKIREAGLTPKVYTDPYGPWIKNKVKEKIEAPDGLGAQDWSLRVFKERQMDKISRGFEKHCGRPLF